MTEEIGPFELSQFLAKKKRKHPWETINNQYRWEGR